MLCDVGVLVPVVEAAVATANLDEEVSEERRVCATCGLVPPPPHPLAELIEPELAELLAVPISKNKVKRKSSATEASVIICTDLGKYILISFPTF